MKLIILLGVYVTPVVFFAAFLNLLNGKTLLGMLGIAFGILSFMWDLDRITAENKEKEN